MLKKIKLFGLTILEVETEESPPTGAPDFTSTEHKVGFVVTSIVPDKLHEES